MIICNPLDLMMFGDKAAVVAYYLLPKYWFKWSQVQGGFKGKFLHSVFPFCDVIPHELIGNMTYFS